MTALGGRYPGGPAASASTVRQGSGRRSDLCPGCGGGRPQAREPEQDRPWLAGALAPGVHVAEQVAGAVRAVHGQQASSSAPSPGRGKTFRCRCGCSARRALARYSCRGSTCSSEASCSASASCTPTHRLTAGVRGAYLAPHPTWSSRTGELVFPREILTPASATGPVAELLTRLERGLEQHFRSKPARIMRAMRDPAFTPAVSRGMAQDFARRVRDPARRR